MALEDNQLLLYDPGDGGDSMEVPVRRKDAFLAKYPNARRLQLYDTGDGGDAMEVPEDRMDAFRAKFPKAEAVYLFDEQDGGDAMEVPRAKIGRYIQSKAAPDKGGITFGSALRDAAGAVGDAAKAVGRTVAAAGAGLAQHVGQTIADLGPGDAARRERQRALDAAPERIPTMKEAGARIGLSAEEIARLPERPVTLRDLDDPRFPQGYRDSVRATMNRVATNAPETDAEKEHRAEAERLQERADRLSAPLLEPRNAAERAAFSFGGGVGTVAELAGAAALGGPAAVPLAMGATGAAREAARQEAEGKTPREAMAGALVPAAAEAVAWTVPLPLGEAATAAGRIGREALSMGVKSDLAGAARRTLSGEEAPDLGERIAEDLGAAAMGAALGGAREGAARAGRAVVERVEQGNRERAQRLAALDPSGTLSRVSDRVAPPDLAEAGANVEAAQAPESAWDAYARRRRAEEAPPLTDYAGEAGREFLERGRGGVDTPPPRIDPEAMEANRRAATARTPEGDAALAQANAELAARQERAAHVAESATPPPASAPRGEARGDVAAETPAPEARGVKPATPDGPRAAIRSELQILLDAGEKDPATLEALASRAEAEDAFATAALARQAAGTYRGTPWGTEGGAWPAEPPATARLEMGDLVDFASELSDKGEVPRVVRRIPRILHGQAIGVFRSNAARTVKGVEIPGDPTSGRVEMLSRLFGLVDPQEQAAVDRRASERAARVNPDPDSEAYKAAYQRAFGDEMGRAVENALRSGPKRAMAVLAHEIGHWVDFLPDAELRRGNVLGHLAALKKYAARTLFESPSAAEAAGAPGAKEKLLREIDAAARKAVKRSDFSSDDDFRAALRTEKEREMARRGLASHDEVRREMERLVAWFRQSDGAPDYFRSDPSELYAEAFSAWVNYPENAKARAPRFAALMEDWLSSHGDAARKLRQFRELASRRAAERAAAAASGGAPRADEAFFARRQKESAAASLAEDPALRQVLSDDPDPPSISRWTRRMAELLNNAVGPRTMIEDMILGAPDAARNPDAIPVHRALLDADNAGNMARLWRYRFDSRILTRLESAGIPLADFRDYLKYSRLGNEITGERMDRGAANKAGPGGVSPGYGATGARARAQDLLAKYGPALEDARRAFQREVRWGDDADGEGSILRRLMESPVLSQAQKDALGNDWYVSLRRAMVPDTTRELTSGREMSNWNGIFRLSTGSLKETGDVIANTLLQDWTMFQQVMRQEKRLRLVDYLRKHKPEWVAGPAEMKVVSRVDDEGRPFTQSVPKQEKREGWRTVTFSRDGKAEGWWVPDFVAQALEPQTFSADRTKGGLEFDAALARVSRASNASLTTGNLVFNPVNALARDPNGLTRYALPRQGEGVRGAIWNTVGDAPLALRSLKDDTGTKLDRAEYDRKVVHALASAALNDTSAGFGPHGGVGGVAGLAEDIRRMGRTDITEDELRRFWQGFGHRSERVEAALAREGAAWRKAAGAIENAWGGYGPGRINEWLGKREVSSKAASLADLEARRPDMDPVERAWWVRNMMGTPDLSNRPLWDRNPRFRLAAPFYTPLAHGVRYQVFRAFEKMPGTLSRRLAAQMAPKVWSIVAPLALAAAGRAAYREWERMKESGRFSQEALDAQLDAAAHLVAVGQAYAEIPLRHRVNGFTVPLPGGYYYYQATDQGLLAIESALLGSVGAGAKQGPLLDAVLGGINEMLPNLGPVPNTLAGIATGYDLNMGREIAGEREEHPTARKIGWTWDNLTGRGLGILPSATVERWITGDGPDAGESARRAWKIPGLSALPGAFIRKRGGGAWAGRAGAQRVMLGNENEMRSAAKSGAAAIGRMNERDEAGKADARADERDSRRIAEAEQRIADLGGDPGKRIDSALERRQRAASGMTPSERLIDEKGGVDNIPEEARAWLDPVARAYIEMPEVWERLKTDPEDRAR